MRVALKEILVSPHFLFLREKPGPFYIESDWTEEAVSAARK